MKSENPQNPEYEIVNIGDEINSIPQPSDNTWVSRTAGTNQQSAIDQILRSKSNTGLEEPTKENHSPEDKEAPSPGIIDYIVKAANYIKSVDGIDEAATLLSQVLPGLAGPIAATAVLTVAAPFVWLGILGMKNEYQRACATFKEILEEKNDTSDKLKKLASFSDEWREAINKRCGLDVKPVNQKTTSNTKATLDEVATEIVKFQTLKNKKMVAALGKRYGWTGVMGMAAMFAGVLASAGKNFLETLLKSPSIGGSFGEAGFANAWLAIDILKFATGGLFLAGQGAMILYAGNRARQGYKKINALNQEKEHITSASGILKLETTTHLHKIIDREIYYIKNHHVRYGVCTIIGQMVMGAGAILGMTGAASIAGTVCFAVGAPLTILPAIFRIVMEGKNERFTGEEGKEYVEKGIATLYDPMTLIGNNINDKERYTKALKTLETGFQQSIDQLVIVKSLSLLHYAMNNRLSRNKSPEEKYEKLMKNFRGSVVKYSQLESPVAKKIVEAVEKNKDSIMKFLALERHEANERIKDCVVNCFREGTGDPATVFETLGAKDVVHVNHQEYFESAGIKINWKGNSRDVTREVIDKSKSILKATRFSIAHTMINIINIEKVAKDIAKDCQTQAVDSVLENPMKKPVGSHTPQNRKTADNDNTPPKTHQNIEGLISDFKRSIDDVYTRKSRGETISKEELKQQQQAINAIREHKDTVPFHLKETYTQDGKTIRVWADPDTKDARYNITYITDHKTKRTEIIYGANAEALILASPQIKAGNGARMFEVKAKTCRAYGDSSNTLFNLPKIAQSSFRDIARQSSSLRCVG